MSNGSESKKPNGEWAGACARVGAGEMHRSFSRAKGALLQDDKLKATARGPMGPGRWTAEGGYPYMGRVTSKTKVPRVARNDRDIGRSRILLVGRDIGDVRRARYAAGRRARRT
jgi:hypothetical protein